MVTDRELTKEELQELSKRAYETCAWEITSEVGNENTVRG